MILLFFVSLFVFLSFGSDKSGYTYNTGSGRWQMSLGGSERDHGASISCTPDGGFVITGYTYSDDGIFDGLNKGEKDIFIVKLDSRFNIQWTKTVGGTSDDWGTGITITKDGDIVVAGITQSKDGDFTSAPASTSTFVIKLNAQGVPLWKRTFPAREYTDHVMIVPTADGGVVVAGDIVEIKPEGQKLKESAWEIGILKLDAQGNTQWKRAIPQSTMLACNALSNTHDGGYVITGRASPVIDSQVSYVGDNADTSAHSFADIALAKLDSNGNVSWHTTYGGSSWDESYAVAVTADDHFIITGRTSSTDGDFVGMKLGDQDIFVIKVDPAGLLEWKKSFGGSDYLDIGNSVVVTHDGGIVVSGEFESEDGDFQGMFNGEADVFVLKLDKAGAFQWKRSCGGYRYETCSSMIETNQKQIVLVGATLSDDSDFDGMNSGEDDIFIMKLDRDGSPFSWKKSIEKTEVN